jgi:acetyl-CoA acetyltransferase family protein
MADAFICDAIRTPIGKRNGALSATLADVLGAHVLDQLVERNNIPGEAIEDVVMGCVTQIGEQGWNIGRLAVLSSSNLPATVPGVSVNRMCGSSLQTTNFSAQAIMSGQVDLVIAAGVENMSRVAMSSDGGIVSEQITDQYNVIPQGFSAELIATQWDISREEMDEFSYNSHKRALASWEAGYFDDEVVPITVLDPEGNAITLSRDETPRVTTLEKMSGLKPAFNPEGSVTAGNSSQICDGAAGLLMASEAAVATYGLTPRARIVSTGVSGVDPTIALTGNPDAIRIALKRAGLTLADMSVIEVNEAFACVPLQTIKDLDISDRMADFNPCGGGISLGHPLGASGARILATMIRELERRDGQYGIASMCIGMGMAIATVIERVK